MAVIEFFERRLFEIINESFRSFLRVHCWKPTVLWLFTVCHSSFKQDQSRLFVCPTFLKSVMSHKVSMKRRLSLDMPSSLMCTMISLFCWLLYRDRFKCLGGTPIHSHVQHSPMASSPFPVPRKKDVIVNLDPTLIRIHSPSGSQTHAWTINSCTAINLAQRGRKDWVTQVQAKKRWVKTRG